MLRDQQGIERLPIYAPLKDVPEDLREVFPPGGGGCRWSCCLRSALNSCSFWLSEKFYIEKGGAT